MKLHFKNRTMKKTDDPNTYILGAEAELPEGSTMTKEEVEEEFITQLMVQCLNPGKYQSVDGKETVNLTAFSKLTNTVFYSPEGASECLPLACTPEEFVKKYPIGLGEDNGKEKA